MWEETLIRSSQLLRTSNETLQVSFNSLLFIVLFMWTFSITLIITIVVITLTGLFATSAIFLRLHIFNNSDQWYSRWFFTSFASTIFFLYKLHYGFTNDDILCIFVTGKTTYISISSCCEIYNVCYRISSDTIDHKRHFNRVYYCWVVSAHFDIQKKDHQGE